MISYPVTIARSLYTGSDPNKLEIMDAENRVASELEQTINNMILNQIAPVHTYTYSEIASETGLPYDIVQELGFTIDGGRTGFTAAKPSTQPDK